MTFRVYFYKGTRPGLAGVYNRLVRKRARGKYSHVELRFSDGWSASASFEDGGTRFKNIEYSEDRWDYIELPIEWEEYARKFFVCAARNNKGYDLVGNVFIAFGFIKHSIGKFFCSEIVARALKIQGSYRFEPNALHSAVHRAVQAYHEGVWSVTKAA